MKKSDVLYYPVLDSTNKELKSLAGVAYEGLTVVAGRQTAGRGRLGRSFISPEGGLYMSVFLKPTQENFTLITAAAAVAVTNVLKQEFCIDAEIKWVNDIILKGKKICGILAESVFNGGVSSGVVLGIGLNLKTPSGGFDSEIASVAGAIEAEQNTSQKLNLACKIATEIINLYPCPEEIYTAYASRSYVIGKEISVIQNGECKNAFALGIDRNCSLIIECGGKLEVLRTGEISIRMK